MISFAETAHAAEQQSQGAPRAWLVVGLHFARERFPPETGPQAHVTSAPPAAVFARIQLNKSIEIHCANARACARHELRLLRNTTRHGHRDDECVRFSGEVCAHNKSSHSLNYSKY
jgi:hypothetical protein